MKPPRVRIVAVLLGLLGCEDAAMQPTNGFRVQSHASISARFNDIDGAAAPVEVGDYTTLDLTCNWWGSPDGPQGVPSSLPSTVYTPWADAQIAGTGTTDCTGGTATGPAVDAYAPDRSMRLEARPAATTAPRSDGGF